jgi:enolase-phosphatase E1
LDIEGTTTPIDFVTKTLFPYASRKLESFLHDHFHQAEIQSLLQDLHAQHQRDAQRGFEPPRWMEGPMETQLRSAVAYGQWLIAKDSKCPSLKALQGKIWQQGYASGELRGEVYPDVAPAFARWRAQQKQICIYSSGSELAQRLLFSTVPAGDLTSYLARFFDTRVGAKAESASYKKIAASLGHKPEEVLFISDAVKEIAAAQNAGMQAMLCVRDPSASAAEPESAIVQSFDEIFRG